MKGKYLITTDNFFYGSDGKNYNAVWGEVEIVSDAVLGIKTNVRSSNWFAKVGIENNHIIVAGCQIHYALKTDLKPNDGITNDFTIESGKVVEFVRPSRILILE